MALYAGYKKIAGNGVDGINGVDGKSFEIEGQYNNYEQMIANNPNPTQNVTYQLKDTLHIWQYSMAQSKWNDLGTLMGPPGEPGEPGKPGKNGTDGTDGFSPTVQTSPIIGGNSVTITDAAGPHTFTVKDGKNGENGLNGAPGDDGFSPTVQTSPIIGGNSITITDKTGPHTFVVNDGADGQAGADGANGNDATINGVNTLLLKQGTGITLGQSGSTLTISADNTDIQNEINKEKHTTLTVTAMTEGLGFKSDYSANDIKRHADAGGVVILRFNAPDGSGEQSYNYETYKDNYAIFRRAVVNPTSNYVSRIVIKIDSNKNVTQEEEKIDINGAAGADGKSAYEIAVENGFEGTEQQWLESLKGTNGTNGADGVDGKNATINGITTLTLVEGTNITFAQSGDSLTINSSGGGTITLDTQVSTTSENGVQNKAITKYVDDSIKQAILDSWAGEY